MNFDELILHPLFRASNVVLIIESTTNMYHWENLFESTPKGNPIMYTLLVFSTCGMSVELRFIILNSKRLNRILYLNICFVATICYCRYYTTFAEQLFFTSALNCHYVVFNLLMASAIIPDQYPGKYGELKNLNKINMKHLIRTSGVKFQTSDIRRFFKLKKSSVFSKGILYMLAKIQYTRNLQ